MKLKKKEFLSLKQGNMSVAEYRDTFTQMSRYAPKEVDTDAKRQELFMEGLNDGLQYQLLSHSFASFQLLVDKDVVIENKRKQMEDRKRKFQGQQSGNTSRFRSAPQQAHPQQRYPQGQSSFVTRFPQSQRPPQQQQQQYRAPAQRQQQVPNAPGKGSVSNAPPKNGAPRAPTVVGDNKCYFCGEPGHYSNRCPKKQAQNGQGQKGPQNFV